MKIAFLGDYRSFDYYHIGGTDSIARRLGGELARRGEEIDFIHFGCLNERTETTQEGITLRYFYMMSDALEFMAGVYDHVLTFHVPPAQRPIWIRFRWKEMHRTRFHLYYFGWPEKWLRRMPGFAEARLFPYNGMLFCISPRIYQYVSSWAKRSILLLPPVPENYFLKIEDKPHRTKLCITYMGRIDSGKGAHVAFDIFQYIARECPEFKTRICGYPWKHKSDTIQLHEKLLTQSKIAYEQADYKGYSEDVDNNVRKILRETDVLFLPYDKLSSTIDTPLLLLEGMAHLCTVITKPLGDMKDVYGTGQFMVENFSDRSALLNKLLRLKKSLDQEKKRLAAQNKSREFSVDRITDRFLKAITGVN